MRVLLVLTILLLTALQTLPITPSVRATPRLAPAQVSPCPSPGPADISNQQITAATSNETLPGHVVFPIKQRTALFRGYLPANLQLQLELVFKIRNSDQFQQCLNAINDPSSPYYENFLNATTLEPFLPTSGQKASVTQIFQQNGFTVTPGASPLVLNLNGNVKGSRSAFGLPLALYATRVDHSSQATQTQNYPPTSLDL
jgi:subtilase family serine protease